MLTGSEAAAEADMTAVDTRVVAASKSAFNIGGSSTVFVNPRKTWYNLEEVTTKGEYRVTFRLKRPQPSFLALLASGWSPVYPCHVSPRDMRAHPIGTGPFDVLVNNAGISGSSEQDFYSTEAWHRIMAVNATGVFFGINYAIPAAVRLLTKSVAVQHAKDKIRANSVHPGVMPPMPTSGRTADPAVRAERVRVIARCRFDT